MNTSVNNKYSIGIFKDDMLNGYGLRISLHLEIGLFEEDGLMPLKEITSYDPCDDLCGLILPFEKYVVV